MNQQLISYIRQQLRVNESRQSIINALLAQGWKQSDLDQAFMQVESEQVIPPPPPLRQAGDHFGAVPQESIAEAKDEKQELVQKEFSNDSQLENIDGKPLSWKDIVAFIGAIFGVASLIAWFFPWLGLIFIVIAAVLAGAGMMGSKRLIAIIGLALCALGLVGFAVKLIALRPVAPPEEGQEQQQQNGSTTPEVKPQNQVVANPLLDTTAYTNAQGGYSIQSPKGWQTGQGNNNGREFIIFLSPTPVKDTKGTIVFNENINITSEANKETTPAAYIDKSRQALQKYLTNYKVQEEQDLSIGDQPAKIIGGTFTQNGLQLRSLQMFAFKGTTVYVITGLALITQWNQDSPAMRASLATFKFQ